MPNLAALGGEPVRREPYPEWPVFDQRDIDAVTQVIQSGRWGGFPYPGPNTLKLASAFAEMQGGGYAVPMMNGTVTMEVAMRASNIGWGDEVIVPALTFQATAAAPMAAGAIPVIADVDPQNYCIDPLVVEKAVTPRTRAIIVVHLGSQMADMDAIMEIAERFHLVVVEDCAHAHGAQWRNRGAGTIGDFGSFSLQSSKILTTGEGGILLCRTPELAEKAASIIDCGRPKDSAEKQFTMGANYRLPEIQAALGLVALERFPDQMKQRAENVQYLEESLSEVPGIRLLRRDERLTRRSHYLYGFAIDNEVFGAEHQAVCFALEKEGIPAEEGYPPMHHYDLFQPLLSKLPVSSAFPERFDFKKMSLPVAERAGEFESVWLSECIFRAGRKGIEDAVNALSKLQKNRDEMVQIEEKRKQMPGV